MIKFSKYDRATNPFQQAGKIHATQFVNLKSFSNENCAVVFDGNDEQFVPDLNLFETPKHRRALQKAIGQRFGLNVLNSVENANKIIKRYRKEGVVVNPKEMIDAPTVSLKHFLKLLNSKTPSHETGMFIETNECFVPAAAFKMKYSKRRDFGKAIQQQLSCTKITYKELNNVSHKYGSIAKSLQGGKKNHIRLYGTKKRLITSGRAVLTQAPIGYSYDTVLLPKEMYDAFFKNQPKHFPKLVILTGYPMDALIHTMTWKAIPWNKKVIGVHSSFCLAAQRDFDGDCGQCIPILDQFCAYLSAILTDVNQNLFVGLTPAIEPSPNQIMLSKPRNKLLNEMWKYYVYCQIKGKNMDKIYMSKLMHYLDLHIFNNKKFVTVNDFIKCKNLVKQMIDTQCCRLNESYSKTLNEKIGKVNDQEINEPLLIGPYQHNIFPIFQAGKESMVKSKFEVSEVGAKQNSIFFHLPDCNITNTFGVELNGKYTVKNCFDIYPILKPLPKNSLHELFTEFKKNYSSFSSSSFDV